MNMPERATPDAGTKPTRPYRMRARREAVDRTRVRILEAMADLWLTRPYDEITLAEVAEKAGVSRPTVHRQFGTKDELLIAAAEWKGPQDEADVLAEPGDVEEALTRLHRLYERMGDAIVRALQLEGRVAASDGLLTRGRAAHRAWIEHVFAPWLPAHGDPSREEAVMTLYAATDVMQWKLLRRDFRLDPDTTEDVLRRLVRGALREISGEEETT